MYSSNVNSSARTVHPIEISDLKGRKLTEEDINKKIFRIAPNSLFRDNSFVPEKIEDIKKAYTFKGFKYKKKEKFITYMRDSSKREFSANSIHTFYFDHLDDDKWITVDEAKNQGLILD
ncbi:MAG: hypothetical protein Q8K60_01125 [Parachlamydiaceae bacterium]|nr:hypothetical protein [Parachlamydiaceae bacterium]